jgi:hypothetical protein
MSGRKMNNGWTINIQCTDAETDHVLYKQLKLTIAQLAKKFSEPES